MRVLLLCAALAMPAVPAAAQTKTGTSTAGKSTTTRAAKTTRTATPVKSVAAIPEPVIELPVDGKIVLGNIMKMRLRSLLIGSTMTYDEAVTGWRNRSQLVAAIDAASYRRLPFPAIHHEVVANNMFVVDAVAVVRGATAAPIALQ
jgi:hypothetical protein